MTAPLALPAAGRHRGAERLVFGTLVLSLGGSMLFAALIGAKTWMDRAEHPFRPRTVHLDQYLGTMIAITALLSWIMATWGAGAVRRSERRQALFGFGLALGLGVAGVNLLTFSAARFGFPVNASSYGLLLYALVGAAVVNGAVGAVYLVGTLLRLAGGQVSSAEPDQARAAAWYWTFVAISWLAVVLTIYPIIKLR